MSAARLHLILAGLYGAAGVALMAAGAHMAGGNATTAGLMLVLHAGAVIALTAARKGDLLAQRIGRVAISLLLLGVALFSSDLALRAFYAGRLFPLAAPAGGSLTIFGWLLAAVAALRAPMPGGR